jgi:hypothetical protein
MTTQSIAMIAFTAGAVMTFALTSKLDRFEKSSEASEVPLQIRSYVASLYGSAILTNGLLAAVLVVLIVR